MSTTAIRDHRQGSDPPICPSRQVTTEQPAAITGRAIWRGPSRCTWPASATKRSNSCSAPSPPTKPRPKSTAPWGISSSKWATSQEAARSYRALTAAQAAVRHGLVQPGRLPGAHGRLGRSLRGVPQGRRRWIPRTWTRTSDWACATCAWKIPSPRCSPSNAAWNCAPDHEDALFGKAAALQSLGHADEASELYQQILERNPESEESLSNLVLIGMSKEDFDMVREYSERLLDLRPESTVALEGLAAWACAAGEHALTAKFCTLLVSAVPGHFEGWFNLALAHQKSGRWEQAAEAYEEALKLRPQSCREPTPTWASCANSWATWPARAPPTSAPWRPIPTALAPALEPGAAAGAHRPAWKKPSDGTARCWRRRPRKRKRASAWATCGCSARITAAPPKPSKAA